MSWRNPFVRQLLKPLTPPQVVWLIVFCAAAGRNPQSDTSTSTKTPGRADRMRAIEPPVAAGRLKTWVDGDRVSLRASRVDLNQGGAGKAAGASSRWSREGGSSSSIPRRAAKAGSGPRSGLPIFGPRRGAPGESLEEPHEIRLARRVRLAQEAPQVRPCRLVAHRQPVGCLRHGVARSQREGE